MPAMRRYVDTPDTVFERAACYNATATPLIFMLPCRALMIAARLR